jgi:hypothetical protein
MGFLRRSAVRPQVPPFQLWSAYRLCLYGMCDFCIPLVDHFSTRVKGRSLEEVDELFDASSFNLAM